jgi:ATP-dependent helicase/nuclease subunit A
VEAFERLWQQAVRVLCSPELGRFFDPAVYQRARNEVAYLDASGALRRVDRLVEFDAEVWVIDYKTGDPSRMAPWMDAYLAQVGDYAIAMQGLHPGKVVFAGLVLGDGTLVRWTPSV